MLERIANELSPYPLHAGEGRLGGTADSDTIALIKPIGNS